MWIKAENPTDTTGKIPSQTPEKKHLSPSTRKRNAPRLSQWKAKRNQAIVSLKVDAHAQTNNQSIQVYRRHNTD